jgi:hypothetical protein
MEFIKSTSEILAFKVLNRNIDKKWIDWAVDMMMAGLDTEHLIMLAGENAPFNQFELQELVNKVFEELHIDYSNKDQIIKNYASYLIDKALNNEMDSFEVLRILKNICIELDYEQYLYDFFSLYYAKDDLIESENQWYWDGATRENIDEIIRSYFEKWIENFEK